MEHIYGHFDNYQMNNYKEKLHKDIFWLILYKDEATKKEYEHVDFDKYFTFLMKKIDGLNTLLSYPREIVEIMSLLEAAYLETKKEKLYWKNYRKLILDAQTWVDKIGGN